MRPTLARRVQWPELGSRLGRYRASFAAPHAALQPDAEPGLDLSPPAEADAAGPGAAAGSAAQLWSNEFGRALQALKQEQRSEAVEQWLPQLARPDERAELLRRAIDAGVASERAGMLFLRSSFTATSAKAATAAAATAAAGREHPGPPAVEPGSFEWGARWVAYDLPLLTQCGIEPSVRLFNWLLRSLASPSDDDTRPQQMQRSDTVFAGSLDPATDSAALQEVFARRIGPVFQYRNDEFSIDCFRFSMDCKMMCWQ